MARVGKAKIPIFDVAGWASGSHRRVERRSDAPRQEAEARVGRGGRGGGAPAPMYQASRGCRPRLLVSCSCPSSAPIAARSATSPSPRPWPSHPRPPPAASRPRRPRKPRGPCRPRRPPKPRDGRTPARHPTRIRHSEGRSDRSPARPAEGQRWLREGQLRTIPGTMSTRPLGNPCAPRGHTGPTWGPPQGDLRAGKALVGPGPTPSLEGGRGHVVLLSSCACVSHGGACCTEEEREVAERKPRAAGGG